MDGAKLGQLRKPVLEYIKVHYHKAFKPEDETQAGEYYIDALGVNPDRAGQRDWLKSPTISDGCICA